MFLIKCNSINLVIMILLSIICFSFLVATECVPLSTNFKVKHSPDIRNLSRYSDETVIKSTVNEYGDRLLENINEMIQNLGYDPWSVEDIKKGYWWGNLKLTEIQVLGLSSMFRSGDTEMTYCHENKQLQVDMQLGFTDLKFESKYSAKLIGIGPRGSLTGEVKNLEMELSLTIDYLVNQCYVRKFEITKSGHINLKLHGHPLTDWFNNALINSTTTLFKGLILDIVDYVVQKILYNIADQIDSVLAAVLG